MPQFVIFIQNKNGLSDSDLASFPMDLSPTTISMSKKSFKAWSKHQWTTPILKMLSLHLSTTKRLWTNLPFCLMKDNLYIGLWLFNFLSRLYVNANPFGLLYSQMFHSPRLMVIHLLSMLTLLAWIPSHSSKQSHPSSKRWRPIYF